MPFVAAVNMNHERIRRTVLMGVLLLPLLMFLLHDGRGVNAVIVEKNATDIFQDGDGSIQATKVSNADAASSSQKVEEEFTGTPEEQREQILAKTKLLIANPKKDALVGPNAIIFVNLVTPDPAKFQDLLNDSYVCIQLDDYPYSCWPVTHARMKVADLPEGLHRVTASLLHPMTRRLVQSTSSESRLFRSHPDPSKVNEAAGPLMTTPMNPPAPELEAPEDVDMTLPLPEPVSIDMPLLVVSEPKELSATQSHFEAIADVHVTNTTLFGLLFANEFVCLSLDDNPSSCWPISQTETHPFFLGVEDGLHTLVASLSHPYSGEIIPETKSKRRTFFSMAVGDEEQDDGKGLPSPPSRPKKASLSSVHVSSPTSSSTKVIESENSPAAAAASASSRFKSVKMEPAIMFEVEVDGTPRTLTYTRSSNTTQVAQDFCVAQGFGVDGECIGAIDDLIQRNSM